MFETMNIQPQTQKAQTIPRKINPKHTTHTHIHTPHTPHTHHTPQTQDHEQRNHKGSKKKIHITDRGAQTRITVDFLSETMPVKDNVVKYLVFGVWGGGTMQPRALHLVTIFFKMKEKAGNSRVRNDWSWV